MRWTTANVAFPRDRFGDELIAELQPFAPSQLEISDRDGDGQASEVILRARLHRAPHDSAQHVPARGV